MQFSLTHTKTGFYTETSSSNVEMHKNSEYK